MHWFQLISAAHESLKGQIAVQQYMYMYVNGSFADLTTHFDGGIYPAKARQDLNMLNAQI